MKNGAGAAGGGGAVATYAYDARGARKTVTASGNTTVFVADADDRVVLTYDGTTRLWGALSSRHSREGGSPDAPRGSGFPPSRE